MSITEPAGATEPAGDAEPAVPADPSGPSLALVAVTFSPGETLTRFLDSIPAAVSGPVDVVLADNGSTDGAPEAAAARAGVRLVPTGGNLGYGRAANVGIAATDTEWVLAVNPDVVFAPGSIDELLAATARWPRAAALGPLIRGTDGEVYPSARTQPGLTVGIGHALLGWWYPANRWTAAYRQSSVEPVERAAGWLSGACVLLRRSAFDSIGGFDPGYFMYFEDVDLGDRLAAAGWLNVFVPSAEVMHEGAHATVHHRAAMVRAHHRSALRYFSRGHPGWRWSPARLVVRVGLRARQELILLLARTTAARTRRNIKGK